MSKWQGLNTGEKQMVLDALIEAKKAQECEVVNRAIRAKYLSVFIGQNRDAISYELGSKVSAQIKAKRYGQMIEELEREIRPETETGVINRMSDHAN